MSRTPRLGNPDAKYPITLATPVSHRKIALDCPLAKTQSPPRKDGIARTVNRLEDDPRSLCVLGGLARATVILRYPRIPPRSQNSLPPSAGRPSLTGIDDELAVNAALICADPGALPSELGGLGEGPARALFLAALGVGLADHAPV